jgi:hypothetical protein
VTAQLRVNRKTTARLTLASGSRVVATGRYQVKPGTNALRLTVPKQVPRGPCVLKITLVDPDDARALARAGALRDPAGVRPLSLGMIGDRYCVAFGGAAVLFGASFIFRKPSNKPNTNQTNN